MGTLAGAFDPAMRRASMERQLVPGCVVYLEVAFPQVTKPKFLVYVGSDGDELLFVINSEVSALVHRDADALRCQVRIDQASHPFLRHDSHVACQEVLRFSRGDIVDELVKDTTRLKGEVSGDVREQIVAAVKAATMLDVRVQRVILAAIQK